MLQNITQATKPQVFTEDLDTKNIENENYYIALQIASINTYTFGRLRKLNEIILWL